MSHYVIRFLDQPDTLYVGGAFSTSEPETARAFESVEEALQWANDRFSDRRYSIEPCRCGAQMGSPCK